MTVPACLLACSSRRHGKGGGGKGKEGKGGGDKRGGGKAGGGKEVLFRALAACDVAPTPSAAAAHMLCGAQGERGEGGDECDGEAERRRANGPEEWAIRCWEDSQPH
ncbi:unnamed protein product [Closterium sp. Naga37s-1]|nr:unnamed protein product [Closterium sp. Naga37s-1]